MTISIKHTDKPMGYSSGKDKEKPGNSRLKSGTITRSSSGLAALKHRKNAIAPQNALTARLCMPTMPTTPALVLSRPRRPRRPN